MNTRVSKRSKLPWTTKSKCNKKNQIKYIYNKQNITIDFCRKKLTYDKMDAQFKLNPIGALQKLCEFPYWTPLIYEYFEDGKSRSFLRQSALQ
jgi:hypothetical protein